MITEPMKIKIVPAICTQCCARIVIDPSRDAALCPHCGTAFIVEKAIENYNIQEIQNTHVEHINTININTTTKGNASSALYFLDKHLDRRTKRKIEKEKQKTEKEKRKTEERAMLMKYFPLALIVWAFVMVALLFYMRL